MSENEAKIQGTHGSYILHLLKYSCTFAFVYPKAAKKKSEIKMILKKSFVI